MKWDVHWSWDVCPQIYLFYSPVVISMVRVGCVSQTPGSTGFQMGSVHGGTSRRLEGGDTRWFCGGMGMRLEGGEVGKPGYFPPLSVVTQSLVVVAFLL